MRRSRRNPSQAPILDLKVWNVGEIARVVCHENGPGTERMCADHSIIIAALRPAALRDDAAIGDRRRAIEWQHWNLAYDGVESGCELTNMRPWCHLLN